MSKACPCGQPLTAQQIKANGKYCCMTCKGKYHRGEPRQRGFGFEVPSVKNTVRLRPGFRAYLDQRGGWSGENSK